MKSKVWLRVACVFILVHLLGHGVGHATWDKPEDPQMQKVVDAMTGYESAFMGAERSMGDYYNGYSLILFFVYAMSISILWQSSRYAETYRGFAKSVLYPLAFTYVAFGVIEFMYFFPFAGAMSLGAGLIVLFSIYLLSRNQAIAS